MQEKRIIRTALAALAVGIATATSSGAASPAAESPLREMEVMGVQADPQSGAPVVFLRSKQDKRELVMFIGESEARAIALPLERIKPPRPLTHDLMLDALHQLKARVTRAVIADLRDGTYIASLVLGVEGKEISVDSRPSDAIALALRENAPILAAEAAFARAPQPAPLGSGERRTP